MRNRRDRRHGNKTVVHVTNRTVHGLPFTCSILVEAVLLGTMARAQFLYPVLISHYLWMGNHYHMILSGHPTLISPFMGHIESEVAKAMKRLIPGFYKGNFWQGRFKEQRLATAGAVIEKISYTYNNPVRAALVSSIAEYPGISSYKAFIRDDFALLARYHRSSSLKPLYSNKPLTYLIELRKRNSAPAHTLTISPYAWKGSFRETEEASDASLKKRIFERISADEAQHNATRHGSVVGVRALRAARMDRPYTSKTKSKTPFLICDDKELRKILILDYKDFCERCRAAWAAFKKKLSTLLCLPYGAYAPSLGVTRAGAVSFA
jgi:hypothetical protein